MRDIFKRLSIYNVVVGTASTLLFSWAFTMPSFAVDQIFFDDFESGTLDAWTNAATTVWTNSVSKAHSGTRKARIAGNVDLEVLTKEIDGTNLKDVSVSYWFDTSSGWDISDNVQLDWSLDGQNWTNASVITGHDLTPVVEGGEEWVFRSTQLPSEVDGNQFVIRFAAIINGQTDIAYIDDVLVEATVVGSSGAGTPTPQSTVTLAPTVVPSPTVSVTPSVVPTVMATPTPTLAPTSVVTPTGVEEEGAVSDDEGSVDEQPDEGWRSRFVQIFLRAWNKLWGSLWNSFRMATRWLFF